MAQNFQLIDKTTNVAVSLSKVDEDICREVLNVEPHHKFYGGNNERGFNWFDTIGFQCSCGLTLEDGENSVLNYYQKSDWWKEELPVITQIIEYLKERYTTKHWVSIGK